MPAQPLSLIPSLHRLLPEAALSLINRLAIPAYCLLYIFFEGVGFYPQPLEVRLIRFPDTHPPPFPDHF